MTGVPRRVCPSDFCQYSLLGRDIKIAVYDDMLEITSPGLLPPSIDYSDMESRQSDARNKVIAPVFKRLGIIDQWGNGLKLVATEIKKYPDIELRWKEVGLSFQVQFVKKDFGGNLGGNGGNLGGNGGNPGGNLGGDGEEQSLGERIIDVIRKDGTLTYQEIAGKVGIGKRTCERIVAELKKAGIVTRLGSTRSGKWIVNHSGNMG